VVSAGARSAVPLLNDHARRSKKLGLEDVSGLIDASYDVIVLSR
jgi:hypothetical protein